ncbi:ribosomal protein L44E [Bacillus mesophilus]|nr:ribosomal protein L44E [Bacillus mesophilus]
MGVEAEKNLYCETCKEETTHQAYENALEIEFRCTKCNKKTEIVKNFF